eukprot:287873-Amphidinium_carterae.1
MRRTSKPLSYVSENGAFPVPAHKQLRIAEYTVYIGSFIAVDWHSDLFAFVRLLALVETQMCMSLQQQSNWFENLTGFGRNTRPMHPQWPRHVPTNFSQDLCIIYHGSYPGAGGGKVGRDFLELKNWIA